MNYEICEKTNLANCATGSIRVEIIATQLPQTPPIIALADSGTFMSGSGGRISLLANDTFSGGQANTGNVAVSLTGINSITGSSIDPDTGDFLIPPSTLS